MPPVLLKVPLSTDSDEYIEVEVDRRDLGEAVQLTANDRGHEMVLAPYTLAESLDRVLPALRMIITRIRGAEHAPDEIAVDLGLKIGGETGLFFAKGTAEATFTVSLTWRKPAVSPPGAS